jgi:hypothetical protein
MSGNSLLLLSSAGLGAAAIFLGLHVVASRTLPVPRGEAFKVTRGLAGATLTLLALSCAVTYWHLWPEGFLAPHQPTAWPSLVMAMTLGIFGAELCWMLTLRLRHAVPLRPELVGHHVVGVAAASCALFYGMGQATGAVALVTELLPLSGAFVAWGHYRQAPHLVQLGHLSRVWLLKYWRLPVWCFFVVTLQSAWLDGRSVLAHLGSTAPQALQAVAVCRLVALGACIGLIAHDFFCLKLLRSAALRHRRTWSVQQPSLSR